MAQANRTARASVRPTRLKPGVKREQIIEVATEHFGLFGYEDTKWADVAAAVDIGSTALYHYFESKQHCLFEIMSRAVREFRDRFDRIVASHDDWQEALVAVLVAGFTLSDEDVLKLRVLTVEHGRVALPRPLPLEEAARVDVRTLKRDLEFAYGTFFARGMQQGIDPGERPATARARGHRSVQQRLAVVPARAGRSTSPTWDGSTSVVSLRSSAPTRRSPTDASR